jgi:hypothetical protein
MVNPQTWNRYAYVANMPLNGVDCFGLLEKAGVGGSTPSLATTLQRT